MAASVAFDIDAVNPCQVLSRACICHVPRDERPRQEHLARNASAHGHTQARGPAVAGNLRLVPDGMDPFRAPACAPGP